MGCEIYRFVWYHLWRVFLKHFLSPSDFFHNYRHILCKNQRKVFNPFGKPSEKIDRTPMEFARYQSYMSGNFFTNISRIMLHCAWYWERMNMWRWFMFISVVCVWITCKTLPNRYALYSCTFSRTSDSLTYQVVVAVLLIDVGINLRTEKFPAMNVIPARKGSIERTQSANGDWYMLVGS